MYNFPTYSKTRFPPTGMRGFLTTVHADSARETLNRIEDLLGSVGRTPQPRMIARFVNVIVHMDHDEASGKRYVREVLQVTGVDEQGHYVFADASLARTQDAALARIG